MCFVSFAIFSFSCSFHFVLWAQILTEFEEQKEGVVKELSSMCMVVFTNNKRKKGGKEEEVVASLEFKSSSSIFPPSSLNMIWLRAFGSSQTLKQAQDKRAQESNLDFPFYFLFLKVFSNLYVKFRTYSNHPHFLLLNFFNNFHPCW